MRKKAAVGAASPTYMAVQSNVDKAVATATEAYASRFAERYAAEFYRPSTGGGVISSIGIGTYLGECTEQDDADYEDAIATAIASGVNLIDTAINYRCQRSERAVGAAIRRVIQQGTPREALVVCTKGGFLPLADKAPRSRDEYRAYLKREFFDTEILTPDDVVAGGHSIAPGFLRYSIERSRKNLGVEYIDLYYLHNPEQQLAAVTPASLRERLRAAFMVLEDAVARAGDPRIWMRDLAGASCRARLEGAPLVRRSADHRARSRGRRPSFPRGADADQPGDARSVS